MRQNNSRGRGRDTRSASKSRNSNARGPRIDSSRRPKPRKSSLTSSDRRAAANSVFSSKSAKGKTAKPREEADSTEFEPRGFRLQQVLAAAGLGSRRQCEELIVDGRVEVDGKIVTELGVRVLPDSQKIRVDGESLPKSRPTYVALNKPKNTLCTNSDPSGRRRVVDFIPRELGRLFPIGRLDQNSEGLILLTNDGALAERLTHPRYEVPKKYRVQVAGLADYELANALKRGVHIAEGVVQADEVIVKSSHKLSSTLEITLTEGKNREIRRMLARVGHKVMQLQRIQVGSIKLGKLAPGEYRRLTSQEVADLYRLADARPNAETLDVDSMSNSLRQRPLEVTELQEREEEKAAARDTEKGKKKDRDEARAKRNDPNFHDEVKAQFKRKFPVVSDDDGELEDDYSERFSNRRAGRVTSRDAERNFERGSRRRAPKEEFREEFRAESRSAERRRVRRDYDDETRTIGPRKFVREESDSRRDRFNEDASARRERRGSSSRERRVSRDPAPRGKGGRGGKKFGR